MLADKANFGSVLYNHAYFYRIEETSMYWLVERISVFLRFSLVNQQHTFAFTVYNRTVTNIENLCRPFIAAKAGYIIFLEIPLSNANRIAHDLDLLYFMFAVILFHVALNSYVNKVQ